jgi:hypothetical protein
VGDGALTDSRQACEFRLRQPRRFSTNFEYGRFHDFSFPFYFAYYAKKVQAAQEETATVCRRLSEGPSTL